MLDPSPLFSLATSYWQSRTFLAAVKLKIFDHVGGEGTTLAELSQATSISRPKLRLLVTALKELKLVEADNSYEHLKLTPLATTFLASSSPTYLGDSFAYAHEMFPLWDHLEERLMNDSPIPPTKKDTPAFLKSMHNRSSLIVPRIIPLLEITAEDSVLDIAAGAGSWSLALHREKGVSDSTLLEQPELCPAMEEFVQKKGFASAQCISSDYHTWTPSQTYSKVLYFGALHQECEEESAELLSRFWNWVSPGGTLYLLDIFTSQGDSRNLFSSLFGLNMVLSTKGVVHELEMCESLLSSLPQVRDCSTTSLPGDLPYFLIACHKMDC